MKKKHRQSLIASGAFVPFHLAEHLPTPEEITRECERIRAGWSWRERLRRLVAPPDEEDGPSAEDIGWTPPRLSTNFFDSLGQDV